MASILSVGEIQGLQENSNVVTVPSGHKLYAPGHVVQTLNASAPSSGVTTFTSSTFTDTGLSVTITPTYASSKFLIIYTCPVFVRVTGSAAAAGGGFRLYRDSTSIDDPQGDVNGALGNWINLDTLAPSGYWDYFWTHTGNMVDSPNTTSAINYNVKYSHRQGTDSKIGYDGSNYHPRCRMTVMEIAQ